MLDDPRMAHVRSFVVWIPMLDADEGSEVPSASKHAGLATQYFDGEKRLGHALATSLGLEQPLWDVFLFYPPGAMWTDAGAPVPEIVLAQGGGVIAVTPGVLPAADDQSKLLPELRGRLVVVAPSQAEFAAFLSRVALPFAARHPGISAPAPSP
ncbi:MAG: hypothetical protein JWP01_3523 [Myxococcales bacterium]|nr:hypothetical protein [Myxococcales bacterium]